MSQDFEGPAVVLRERYVRGKEASLTLLDASGQARWSDRRAAIVHGLRPTFSSDGRLVAYEGAPGVVIVYDPAGTRTEVNVFAALSPEEQRLVPRSCGGPFIQWLRFEAGELVVPIRQEPKSGTARALEVTVSLRTKTVARRAPVELTTTELIKVYRSEPVRRTEAIQRLRPRAMGGDEEAIAFFLAQAESETDLSPKDFLRTVADGVPR